MRGIILYVLAFGLLEALAAQDVAHRAEPKVGAGFSMST